MKARSYIPSSRTFLIAATAAVVLFAESSVSFAAKEVTAAVLTKDAERCNYVRSLFEKADFNGIKIGSECHIYSGPGPEKEKFYLQVELSGRELQFFSNSAYLTREECLVVAESLLATSLNYGKQATLSATCGGESLQEWRIGSAVLKLEDLDRGHVVMPVVDLEQCEATRKILIKSGFSSTLRPVGCRELVRGADWSQGKFAMDLMIAEPLNEKELFTSSTTEDCELVVKALGQSLGMINVGNYRYRLESKCVLPEHGRSLLWITARPVKL